ncbi:hypothetical protein TNCV_134751 [Trichonephila clavipes]|nr:hypothetical protein TNCV_134751 [Trichonephila clavipes]
MGKTTPIYRQKDTSMNIVTSVISRRYSLSLHCGSRNAWYTDTIEQNSREEKEKGGYVSLSRNSPAKGRWQIRGPYAWKVD